MTSYGSVSTQSAEDEKGYRGYSSIPSNTVSRDATNDDSLHISTGNSTAGTFNQGNRSRDLSIQNAKVFTATGEQDMLATGLGGGFSSMQSVGNAAFGLMDEKAANNNIYLISSNKGAYVSGYQQQQQQQQQRGEEGVSAGAAPASATRLIRRKSTQKRKSVTTTGSSSMSFGEDPMSSGEGIHEDENEAAGLAGGGGGGRGLESSSNFFPIRGAVTDSSDDTASAYFDSSQLSNPNRSREDAIDIAISGPYGQVDDEDDVGARLNMDGNDADDDGAQMPLLRSGMKHGGNNNNASSGNQGNGQKNSSHQHQQQLSRSLKILSSVKTIVLLLFFIIAAVFFTASEETEETIPMYALSTMYPLELNVTDVGDDVFLQVEVKVRPGQHFKNESSEILFEFYSLENNVWIKRDDDWTVDVSVMETGGENTEDIDVKHMFSMEIAKGSQYKFNVTTDSVKPLAASIQLTLLPFAVQYEVLYAALILFGVYILIIFDITHRMLAAMLGSFFTLGILSILNKRPSLAVIVGWIDYETVCLLFGMMTMVGIFAETGFFEYAAVKAYKISKGRVWRLLTILCVFSAIVSAFLDNVTTILLMSPVTIRLCEVLNLDPIPILLAEVLFSNIGGAATAIGDPPNVIIVSNKKISSAGVDFTTFTTHMMVGIIFVAFSSYGALRFLYRNENLESQDPPEITEMKREIQIWRRAAARLSNNTTEEGHVKELLAKKIIELDEYLSRASEEHRGKWELDVQKLEDQYKIKDKPLFINSCIVLGAAIIMFFLHALPQIHLDLGWIAILGAIALLLLSNSHEIEAVLSKIEWGTLLFFASLFILMEGLSELGLISWIGDQTASLIKQVPSEHRLAVSIIIVLWISALASAFIDNIPFTTAMIPVVITLSQDKDVDLPLAPLVWSLALGACLGGNGTLIGASANVVCAGLAEQHGYTITFNRFFRTGFPLMVVSVFTAMIYLLIAHSWLNW